VKRPSVMADLRHLPDGRSIMVNGEGRPARIAAVPRPSAASPSRVKVAFYTRAVVDGEVRPAVLHETRLEMN
jgi:hypothetical protein